jgi:tetratricopeptide (TPR) repeat protein
MGRDEEAISNYLLAQRLAPDNRLIALELGEAYDAAGTALMADGRENEAFENYNNALAAYDAARQLNATNEAVFDGVGRVMLHEGRLTESIDQFDAAIGLNSAFVPARVHKAQAMFNAGLAGDKDQLNLAMPELREALSMDPSNSEAFCAVADMQFRMKNYTAAENGYRSAIRLNPGSAQAWTELGFAQSAQSRFQEALRSFEHALVLQADAPDALRGKHLAQAQLASGNQKS